MAPNTYLRYKNDTSRLIYWIVHTANNIMATSKESTDGEPTEVNTTGEVTVRGLVALSKFIAKRLTTAPPTILRLFCSVIDARTAAHDVFEQIAHWNPDPNLKKNNKSHKYFIDALTESFEALGGKDWVDKDDANDGFAEEDVQAKQQLDLLVLDNKFSVLKLEGLEEVDDDEDCDGVPQPAPNTGPKRRRQPKGKKKARAVESKKDQKSTELPLQSYRIVQDPDGQLHDYLFAAYTVAKDCATLRHILQGVWKESAYEKFNVASAGAMANLAIAMVQRTCSAMFIDFPGRDHYDAVINILAGGDLEQPEAGLTMSEGVRDLISGDWKQMGGDTVTVDVVEELMVHAYKDLVDFIQDFRKTRSGKPTKRLLAQVRDWDPNLHLQNATKEQRIRWRRGYTINFLYDLVNMFSSHLPHRLFGMNEFAGWVTSLAMQKEGTELAKRISPHHVFQLQCAVDSFAVSRGWSTSLTRGHVLTKPAHNFQPGREIEWFLYGRQREDPKLDAGFLAGVSMVNKILSVDPDGNRDTIELLKGLERDLPKWLGDSPPADAPPSRLANSKKSALWEYSPFLCGVGLLEALELAYQAGVHVMERLPVVTFVVHLHRFLLSRTDLGSDADPMYLNLDVFFRSGFFDNGEHPTTHFGRALSSRVAMRKQNSYLRPKARPRGKDEGTKDSDIYQALDNSNSPFASVKSTLLACRKWKWSMDDVHDDDLYIGSVLFLIRLASQKLVFDPVTGEASLPESDLTKRAKAESGEEAMAICMASIFAHFGCPPPSLYDKDPSAGGRGKNATESASKAANSCKPRFFNLTGPSILRKVTMADILHEVGGSYPIYGINYMALTAASYQLLSQMWIRLAQPQLANPLFERRGNSVQFNQMLSLGIRVDHIYLAMEHEDLSSMRIMAELFRAERNSMHQFMYWGHQETKDEMHDRMERGVLMDAEDGVDGCVVM